MMDVAQNLFWILVFPGFLFTVACGIVAAWIVRKVTALIHHRIGPPLLQPFYDVVKLMGKETLIPEASQGIVFVAAPMVALASAILLSTMLWRISFAPNSAFLVPFTGGETTALGDIIVAVYLMVIPALALILGSSASGSPHAAIGSSREMKLVMGYELSLVLAMTVVIIKTASAAGVDKSLSLAAIAEGTPVLSVSGFLAFLVVVLCVQAKLGFVPFDIAEAETELAGGVLIEYSGPLLAIWQLVQMMLLVALPLFVVMVFMGGFGRTISGVAAGVGKYVLVVVLLILIKNTNPRMRVDQTMKFFWWYCGPVLVVAIVLAMLGGRYGISWL